MFYVTSLLLDNMYMGNKPYIGENDDTGDCNVFINGNSNNLSRLAVDLTSAHESLER